MDNFVFFWKKDEKYGMFSNWSEHSIKENGKVFFTAEHYLMYSKAVLFNDYDTADKIVKTPGPLSAKNLGRQVKNFNETVWIDNRTKIIENALQLKFEQHEDIRKALLESGNKIIAEASPYDKIWGIGISVSNKNIMNVEQWNGLNILGKAWMKIRENNKI